MLSVHSVVSFDFAVAIVPGWHSTIFPPYFVAGAIYSGFAMVLNIIIPVRKIYHLEHLITERYLNNMANIMLATGMIVAYGYFIEAFMAWYSGDIFEHLHDDEPRVRSLWLGVLAADAMQRARAAGALVGPYPAQSSAAFRRRALHQRRHVDRTLRDRHHQSASRFSPSAWAMFYPTKWDWMTLFGSVGLFLTLLFLFIRFLPMISISETRELVAEPEKATTP